MRALKLLLFCLIVFLGVSSFTSAAPLPQTLYVKFGTNGTCTSWATACELQTAMFKANPGDQIWVAKGTYKPTKSATRTATFQLESGVAIYGGFPPADGTWIQRDWVNNLTTLSGDIGLPGDNSDNSYHVVTGSGVDINAVLDVFTISGGNANGAEPHNYGGGMYNSGGSPVLTNVTFTENSATDYGSGMYNVGGNPKLTNVTFTKNLATKYGGGMYNDYGSPTLASVTFSGNTASNGGGVFNTSSSPMLTDVTFTKNSATVGGGMSNESSNPTLTNVTFSGNKASNGGGMVNNFSGPTLTNVTFTENRASAFGGGMVNWSSSPTLTNVTLTKNSAVVGGGMSNQSSSSPTLTNVTFTDNSATYSGGGMDNDSSGPTLTNVTFTENSATYYGGGMVNWSSSPTLTNVTFSGNMALEGGGMSNDSSSPTLTNAIVWGNTPALDQIKNVTDSHLTVTYSDIEGGFDGDGNINDDPHLGPLADNGGFTQTLALLSGSPAIDTANPAFCPTYDQRYYARPIDGDGDGSAICDMGAYEYG